MPLEAEHSQELPELVVVEVAGPLMLTSTIQTNNLVENREKFSIGYCMLVPSVYITN